MPSTTPPSHTQPYQPDTKTHLHYLREALTLARLSPPKPTNFRVGCVIVSYPTTTTSTTSTTSDNPSSIPGTVLSTGYTLELEGNTHAEQNALTKLIQSSQQAGKGASDAEPTTSSTLSPSSPNWSALLPAEANATLYTTLEPCGLRLSGNLPCVERIIATRKSDSATGGNAGSEDDASTSRGGGRGGHGIRKVVFGAREPGTFVADSKSLQRLDQAGVPWEFVDGLAEEILSVAKEGHVKKEGEEGKGDGDGAQGGTSIDDISVEERRRQEALPRNPKKRMMEVDVPP